jgi:NADH:ubiquinone oxidoreductase subunit H
MCIILTGYFSKNKYAMLAAVRSCFLVINLELFMGLMVLNLVLVGESFSFFAFAAYQEIF